MCGRIPSCPSEEGARGDRSRGVRTQHWRNAASPVRVALAGAAGEDDDDSGGGGDVGAHGSGVGAHDGSAKVHDGGSAGVPTTTVRVKESLKAAQPAVAAFSCGGAHYAAISRSGRPTTEMTYIVSAHS
jgi:hypothetical protein